MGDKVNSFYVPKGITLILYLTGFLFVALTQDLGPILLIVSFAVLLFLIIISLLRQKGFSLKILSPNNDDNKEESGFWNTVTIQVMKWPYISMTLAGCFLLFLSYFYLDLEKGSGGISALPDEEPVKIGFSLLDEKFGFGSDAPANIVIDANIESINISNAIEILESLLIEDSGFNAPEIIT